MPTNRTRRTRGRTGAVTGRQIEHLIYGWCLPFDLKLYGHSDIHFPFMNEDHRRACWEENREYILSFTGQERIPGVFGAYPLKPGGKPQAMINYESKPKRKRIMKNEKSLVENRMLSVRGENRESDFNGLSSDEVFKKAVAEHRAKGTIHRKGKPNKKRTTNTAALVAEEDAIYKKIIMGGK